MHNPIKTLTICAVALLLAGCSVQRNDRVELTDWQFEYNGQWYPATVPGNIHDDLLHNRLILDPHYGTNEDSVQWVADSVWIYRLVFDVENAESSDFSHRQLVFEGLDTYAEVSLNGEWLTPVNSTQPLCNNMFRRWTFEVGKQLKKKDNELIVKFLPSVPFEQEMVGSEESRQMAFLQSIWAGVQMESSGI